MSGVCLYHATSLSSLEITTVVQYFPFCHTFILYISWVFFPYQYISEHFSAAHHRGHKISKWAETDGKSGVSTFTDENVCPFNNNNEKDTQLKNIFRKLKS